MGAIELDNQHAAFRCKVAGCSQWVVMKRRLLTRDRIGLSIEPFETMCPSCGWFQTIQPGEVIFQSDSRIMDKNEFADHVDPAWQSRDANGVSK
jgi:hypothetical protein